MPTCERINFGVDGDGMTTCRNQAKWYFNYNYEAPDAQQGRTALCQACYEQSVKDKIEDWKGNLVPPDKRMTPITEKDPPIPGEVWIRMPLTREQWEMLANLVTEARKTARGDKYTELTALSNRISCQYEMAEWASERNPLATKHR